MPQSNNVTTIALAATPASGQYSAGQAITFALTPAQPVQVAAGANGALPYLTLNNGATAGYAGQDASGSLLFGYTVTAGQDASDLVVTGLQPNGASMSAPGGLALAPAATYAAGPLPQSVAVADVNGDGVPDLVAADFGGGHSTGSVSVLLGTGRGAFGAATTYAAGQNPVSITVADLDGDGKPDLAVADAGGGVSVLLGTGGGAFGTAAAYAADTRPQQVVAADLDGNGRPDLVFENGNGSVSVLLGTGGGSFAGGRSDYSMGPFPDSIAVADVDRDGKLDLVAADAGGGTVAVRLGTGGGAFAGTFATYAVGSEPFSVAVADVDGDGKPDLAVAAQDGVAVLRGLGNGSFGAASTYASGTSFRSVAVADVDRDGRPDLVVANSGGVEILLGAGGGSFGAPIPERQASGSLTVADLDGDGRPDLVVANSGGASVLLNRSGAAGTFDPTSVASAPGHDTGLVIDTTPPSATLAATESTGSPTAASALHYQLTLSEPVAGLGTGSFRVGQGGSLSGAAVTGVQQQDATHYLVTVATGTTGNGALSLSLPASGSGVTDVAGNGLSADASGAAYTVVHSPAFAVVDTSNGQSRPPIAGDPYSGPVAGLQYQYVTFAADNLNVTANLANTFIHTGSGFDAIDVSGVGGTNVLDGGTGSNFLVGGTGAGGPGSSQDTFFVDDRSPTADIWSTVANFHLGDAATVFGVTPQDYALEWVDGQGAQGYTGLTLHATAAGRPTASLTLAGYSTADLANGRLTTSFGIVDGNTYLYVKGTG